MNNWLILIVGTDKIFDEFYKKDPDFNDKNYVFFNVSKNKVTNSALKIINSYDIDGYEHLGYPYAESEVIYNVYKLNLFSEYDYIGIMHYDFELYNKANNTYEITKNINLILRTCDYISFQNMKLGYIYKYANIMLDERDKNCVFPQFSKIKNPRTAFDYTFDHLNKLNGTNISIKDFNLSKSINMCCSFLMKRELFNELGKLVSNMIDEHYMDFFDEKKINRIPGNVIERVIGIFSLLHTHVKFDLTHKQITSHKTLKDGTFLQKVRYE